MLELQRTWLARSTQSSAKDCHLTALLPTARDSLETSLALMPANVNARVNLGRIAWLEGRCDEAIQLWQQAASGQSEAAAFELLWRDHFDALPQALRLRLADFAYQRGLQATQAMESNAAEQWYQRAFDLYPQRQSAEKLVSTLDYSRDISQTINLWQSMAASLPESTADHWWASAELYGIKQAWQAAALAYEQGAKLTDASFDFWLEAGRAWEQITEYNQARIAYEHARQVAPEFPQSYIGLGNVYREQQDYQAAVQWYEMAEQIQPTDFNPYYLLGITYFQMQRYAEARQNLDKALKLNPDHDGSLYYLALVAHAEKDIASAEVLLVKAIDSIRRIAEPPGEWLLQLGDWRLERQNCAGARQAYGEAQQMATVTLAAQEKLDQLTGHCQP